jgi:hydrogenase nickel incorporation protein HypA/HybF
MHEVSIISSIIDSVLVELGKHQVEKVEEVYLTLGSLTFLGEDQLEFAYDVLSKGTKLDGSKLVIEKEDVEIRCRSCGYQGPSDNVEGDFHGLVPILQCPTCGEDVDVIKGKSCTVRSIRVVQKDVPVQG